MTAPVKREPGPSAVRERGMSLLVVLIMLVVLTLFALSAINLSTSNLKVVGNMQSRQSNESVALQAIEAVMASVTPFQTPASTIAYTPTSGTATTTTYSTHTKIVTSTGYTIEVYKRNCLFAAAATGYSAVIAIAPEDTHWDFQVIVTENVTGARSVMHQGVKIRMLAGNCP